MVYLSCTGVTGLSWLNIMKVACLHINVVLNN